MIRNRKKELERLDDEIYQDSIDALDYAWERSREQMDEGIIVEEILDHYEEELKKFNLTKDEIEKNLYEWAFNGIT